MAIVRLISTSLFFTFCCYVYSLHLTLGEERSLSWTGFSSQFDNLGSSSTADSTVNEVPRLPVWNNGANYGDGQRHIDFTQLFEVLGEPRGSRGREMSELISRPRPKCNRQIRILNGVTRIRERGSLARFQCSHGFTLIGPRNIVCLRDRWSRDPPICVKSGCRPLRTPTNGEIREPLGGAVAVFYCLRNTKLIGNAVIFCDGNKWNGTEPICQIEAPTTVHLPTTLNKENEAELDWEWDTNVLTSERSDIEENSRSIRDSETTDFPQDQLFSTEMYVDTANTFTTTEDPFYKEPIHSTRVVVQNNSFGELSTTQRSELAGVQDLKRHNSTFQVAAQSVSALRNSFSGLPFTTNRPEREISQSEQHRETDAEAVGVSTPKLVLTTDIPTPPTSVTTSIPTTESERSLYSIPFIRNRATTTFRSTLTTSVRRYRFPTRRPRGPIYTKKPMKRPFRRRTTTTTTMKPLQFQTEMAVPYRPVYTTTFNLPPVQDSFLAPVKSPHLNSKGGNNTMTVDREVFPGEHIAHNRPVVKPDMLSINVSSFIESSRVEHSSQVRHSPMIGGIIIIFLGLTTFSTAIVMYCWRKNKGIARARPHDLDGRTLSLHDGNDDFTWLDQSQRESSAL